MKNIIERLRNNKKILIGVLAALGILVVVPVSLIVAGNAKPLPYLTFKPLLVFEYGDVIEDKEKSLIDSSASLYDELSAYDILTDSVGKQSLEIVASLGKKTKTYNVEYEVVDTHKPEIVGVVDQIIEVGDEFDALQDITSTDPVDGVLEVKTSTDVDTSKIGTTEVVVFSEDNNGNRSEKSYTLVIKEKEVATAPMPTPDTKPVGGANNEVPASKPQPPVEKPTPEVKPEPPVEQFLCPEGYDKNIPCDDPSPNNMSGQFYKLIKGVENCNIEGNKLMDKVINGQVVTGYACLGHMSNSGNYQWGSRLYLNNSDGDYIQ